MIHSKFLPFYIPWEICYLYIIGGMRSNVVSFSTIVFMIKNDPWRFNAFLNIPEISFCLFLLGFYGPFCNLNQASRIIPLGFDSTLIVESSHFTISSILGFTWCNCWLRAFTSISGIYPKPTEIVPQRSNPQSSSQQLRQKVICTQIYGLVEIFINGIISTCIF